MAPGAKSNTPSVMHSFAHLKSANDYIVNEAFCPFMHVEQVVEVLKIAECGDGGGKDL